jgi:hypothetical protein
MAPTDCYHPVRLSQVEISADILGGIIQALDACWLSFAAFAEDGADGSALEEAAFVISMLDALTSARNHELGNAEDRDPEP